MHFLPRSVLLGTLLTVLAPGAFAADSLEPPAGVKLAFEVSAKGVQIYECRANGNQLDWALVGPDAMLFDKQDHQVGTHFVGPAWKAEDGSIVIGEAIAKAPADVDGAVPWLLLRAKAHEGTGKMSAISYIRRQATRGGAAPATGCDAGHQGAQSRIPYSASYQFFTAQ